MKHISGVEMYVNKRPAQALQRRLRRFFMLVLCAALVYGWWSTRDTTPRWKLIPTAMPISFVVQDPLDQKQRFADSTLWKALPHTPSMDRLGEAFAADPGVPDWLLRNVLGKTVYVTAGDRENMEDAIVLTRMTRVGVLAERIWSTFGGGVENEKAGGLHLRSVPDSGLYYAIRGRTLIASPSRDTLIGCLTLAKDASISEADFNETLGHSGSEDFRGRIVLADDDPGAQYIRAVAFAARLDDREAKLRGRVFLQPALESRLDELARSSTPVELPIPPDGAVRIALNLGAPLNRVADMVAVASGSDDTLWQKWRRVPSEESELLPHVITQIVDNCGPAATASIVGVDVNEMIPVPLVVWSADGDEDVVDTLGTLLETVGTESLHPLLYDSVKGIVALPYMGGPSLTPTVARYRGQVIASNSFPTVERMISQGPTPRSGQARTGNLAIDVAPGPLASMVLEIGQLFADAGAIRGYSSESFREAATAWQAQATQFEALELVGLITEGGSVELDLAMRLTGAATTPPAQP